MKKLLLVLTLTSLTMLGAGCMVRAHGPGPVAVKARVPGAVVVAKVPAPHTCARQSCRRVCGPFRCWNECSRVLYRCY